MVQREHIERAEVRRTATEQQCGEVRTTVGIQTNGFTIEDRRLTPNRPRDFSVERWPLFELMAAARDEPALSVFDILQRAESHPISDFIDEIRMVEWLRDRSNRIGAITDQSIS